MMSPTSVPDWLPLVLAISGLLVIVYALPGPIHRIILKPIPADSSVPQEARRAAQTFVTTVLIGLLLIAAGIRLGGPGIVPPVHMPHVSIPADPPPSHDRPHLGSPTTVL